MARKILLMMASLAFAGCAEGIEPPDTTDMVKVGGATYLFGDNEQEFCVNAKTAAPPTCVASSNKSIPPYYPAVVVEVGSFWLDTHEVTNIQYDYCVQKGECSRGAADPCNAVEGEQGEGDYCENEKYWNYPVVNVTWDEAKEYCEWVGKRLPSEYEWELAAKGPDAAIDGSVDEEDLVFAGNPFPALGVEVIDNCQTLALTGDHCRSDQFLDPAPLTDAQRSDEADKVRVNSADFAYHMFGNVAEWTSDWFDELVTCKRTNDGAASRPCLRESECSDGDADCLIAASNCPLCDPVGETDPLVDRLDDTVPCFYTCEGQDRQEISCERLGDRDEVFTPDDLSPVGGSKRTVRGGAAFYGSGATCLFRSAARVGHGEGDRKN